MFCWEAWEYAGRHGKYSYLNVLELSVRSFLVSLSLFLVLAQSGSLSLQVSESFRG